MQGHNNIRAINCNDIKNKYCPAILNINKFRIQRQILLLVLIAYAMGIFSIYTPLKNPAQEIPKSLPEYDNINFFMEVFYNNLGVLFTIVIGGFLSFGLISMAIIFLNGAILGSALETISSSNYFLLISIIPHGILEIPTILFAGYLGIILPKELVSYLINEGEIKINSLLNLKANIQIFNILIVVTLISALIETYITPSLTLFILENVQEV